MSMLFDIILPVLGLLVLGAGVPFCWSRLLPEGTRPLILNAALSVLTCILAATLVRLVIGNLPGWGGLLRWIGLTALVWMPAVILGIAQQPSRWQEETW